MEVIGAGRSVGINSMTHGKIAFIGFYGEQMVSVISMYIHGP